MSYFSQMVGLTFHNFVSAAVGIAVAAALVRGIARNSAKNHREFLGGFDSDKSLFVAADLPRVCGVFSFPRG